MCVWVCVGRCVLGGECGGGCGWGDVGGGSKTLMYKKNKIVTCL